MKLLHKSAFILLCIFAMSNASWAVSAEPSNADALHGLVSSKAVFDITTQDPHKLSFYLDLINKTAMSMKEAGVTPHFVLAFRGPATFLTTTNRDHVKIEDMPTADKIEEQLTALSRNPDMKLEQCSVAAHALHVDTKTIYPSVKVIGNSWVSLIGYQNRGYAIVPVR